MNTDFTPPPDFWPRIVEQCWEKKPVVIKNPFGRPLITADEVFDTFQAASERFRSGRRDVPLRLYIDNTRLGQSLGAHFPNAADGSLVAYAERLNRQLEGRPFMFVLNNFQAYNHEVWQRLRAFLGGLFERVGIPAGTADADAFIGNYQKTSAGIHKDPAGNFTFLVSGRKRMLVWPYEFFLDKVGPNDPRKTYFQLDGVDYREFRDQATVLEGEPGDILYWPSTSWHIGEGADPLHVSLNVSLFLPWQPAKAVLGALARLVERRLGESSWASTYPFDPARIGDVARELPADIEQVIRAVREAAQDPRLEHEVKTTWMSRVTGFGFQDVPFSAGPRALCDEDVVRCDPRAPIAWSAISSTTMICSANGHSFNVPAHPHIANMLAELNQGRPTPVGDLLDRFAGEATVEDLTFELSRDDARALLERLLRARALEVTR